MAIVRHSTCRIDFDPEDITGNSIITVYDTDGVTIETMEVRTTHLISAVTKLMTMQVRRNAALVKMIGEMDDEINGAEVHTPVNVTADGRCALVAGTDQLAGTHLMCNFDCDVCRET